jgi:hypothetical protein
MGQTLKELLESSDLGAGGVKTASARATAADVDGMDKLAMQLGLFGATEKVAASAPDAEEAEEAGEEQEEAGEDEGEKKASAGGLHALLFPNSVLGETEKTASEKLAAAEQALGAMAYDQFARSFDSFVEKLASEAISAASEAAASLPNNKAGGSAKIDTSPAAAGSVKAENGDEVVGLYEQKTAAALAFRKHLLLSQING